MYALVIPLTSTVGLEEMFLAAALSSSPSLREGRTCIADYSALKFDSFAWDEHPGDISMFETH
jgi:hypothetical protein